MLFDWLVVGHALEVNPAHTVCGPRYSQTKGKTAVLNRDKARRIANHSDTRTTQLYDQRSDAASLREYEKVGI